MEVDEAIEYLQGFTYKPCMRITIEKDIDPCYSEFHPIKGTRYGIKVRVKSRVIDSHDPTQKIKIDVGFSIRIQAVEVEYADRQWLKHWFIEFVIDHYERHEMDEWLRHDGKRLKEPHTEEQRADHNARLYENREVSDE